MPYGGEPIAGRRRRPVTSASRGGGPFRGASPGVGGGSRETTRTNPRRSPGTPTNVPSHVARGIGPIHATRDEGAGFPNLLSALSLAAMHVRRNAAARRSVDRILANAPSYLSGSNPLVKIDQPLATRTDPFGRGYSVAGLEYPNPRTGHRVIKLSEGTTQRLAEPRYMKMLKRLGRPPSPYQKEAYQQGKQTLLHELVHTDQPGGLPHWLVEGGAELLSRKVSRAQGNTFLFDVHHPYQPFVRKVKRRGGARLVRKTLLPRG